MRGLVVSLVILISSSACSTDAKKALHLKNGEEYLAEGKQREAIIEFLNVIQLDENDPVATQRLAVTLYETGQLGPAFRYLQRAAELDPNDTDVRVKLATLYLYSGQREEAREEAGAVLEKEPENLDALRIFADTVATLLGRTEEANKKLDRLVEDAPDFLPAWQRIATYSFTSTAAKKR